MTDGLWIQSAAANADLFTDSLQYDGVIRTQSVAGRILFGFGNNVPSAVSMSQTGALFNNDISIKRGGTVTSVWGELQRLSSFSPSDGYITSNMISASNVPPSKLAGVVPVPLGGSGQSNHLAGGVLVGAGNMPLATFSNLTFDGTVLGASKVQVASSLSAASVQSTGTVSALSGVTFGVSSPYRLGAQGDDAVLYKVNSNGTEEVFINFSDVRRMLDNIAVVE